MALPKIETPTYELKLPSKDETIAFRPFTVREEKILMIASESEKPDEVYNAITRMIDACTFNKIECVKLPLFDIEYIFLQIRSKSVGEVAKFRVVCPDDLETYAEVEVDISKVEVHVDDNHTNRIVLDESRNLGVVFAYPTMGVTKVANDITNAKTKDIFEIIYSCVDHIFEGEKIYPAKDTSKDDMIEFFDSISQENLVDVKKFFDTMPQLKHTTEVENPKTKVKSKVVLSGLQSFFVSPSHMTT